MPFLQGLLVAIASAAVSSLSSWAVLLRSRKAKIADNAIEEKKVELEKRTVEGDAYEKAQRISDSVVSALHQELNYLRTDLAEERAGRAADNRRHAEEVAELHRLVDSLRRDLESTRAQLD